VSSFLSRTTAFAYLEFAANRLQAEGHTAEIVRSSTNGGMALVVDGVEQTEDNLTKLLAAVRPNLLAHSVRAAG
jgi:hypothetical protein